MNLPSCFERLPHFYIGVIRTNWSFQSKESSIDRSGVVQTHSYTTPEIETSFSAVSDVGGSPVRDITKLTATCSTSGHFAIDSVSFQTPTQTVIDAAAYPDEAPIEFQPGLLLFLEPWQESFVHAWRSV